MGTETILRNIKVLIEMHATGRLGGEIMPEDALIGIIPKQRLPDVLTLGMSLNYQRNSYALWKSIAEAYLDEKNRWVFNPHCVHENESNQLRKVLISHRIALQPNRHPEIWRRVSNGIVNSSASADTVGMIESVGNDIAALKDLIQVTRKPDFPYLSGPKIFNYWVYVLETYCGVHWESRELITIAPDTHIIKASVKLGLCSPDVLRGTAKDRQTVAEAWNTVLSGSGFSPIDVHTPLWLWSRSGFPSLESVSCNR